MSVRDKSKIEFLSIFKISPKNTEVEKPNNKKSEFDKKSSTLFSP
jgi:hypothetical protein